MTARPGARRGLRAWFADRPIAAKLSIAFGSLVALTLIVIAAGFLASNLATIQINRTNDLRAPTALASARAQSDLLRMLSEMRGYLALGDPALKDGFVKARADFDQDLADLAAVADQATTSGYASDVDTLESHLTDFRLAYSQFGHLPDQLFAIRDDQLQREPALAVLLGPAQDAVTPILVSVADLIDVQGSRPATAAGQSLLADMSSFQSSFLSEVSGLRGYVTTQRPSFKFEYSSNLTINDSAFERLLARRARLDPGQQLDLDRIATARAAFAPLPGQMIAIVEGDHAREDLWLFRMVVTPVTDRMLTVLSQTTADEAGLLQGDLRLGRDGLASAQLQALGGGLAALLVAAGLAIAFRRTIAGPIRRLTGVAETITEGDLEARARVETGDEIGRLAQAFNTMTGRLGDTVGELRTTNAVQAEYIEEVGHVTDAAAAVEADQFETGALEQVERRDDALGQLARTFVRMAREVRAREERLRSQVRELRIEIDEARQARKVAEITGTDYFRGLRERATELRRTMAGEGQEESAETGETPPVA